MKLKILLLFIFSILPIVSCSSDKEAANQDEKIEPILKNRWTDKISPDYIIAEYPRPIQHRKDWMNFNGYRGLDAGEIDSIQFGQELLEKNSVPFVVESYLSDVMKKANKNLYKS